MKRKTSSRRRKPQSAHDKTPAIAAGCCACGCGKEVKPGSKFRQGHDARLGPNSAWRKAHPELFQD